MIGFTALAALLAALGACAPAVTSCEPAEVVIETPVRVVAFCGAHPDDAAAPAIVASLAYDAGMYATAGPCNEPDATYSPAFTGQRYSDPATYMRLVELNASVGMKTVVFDARLWSPEMAVRTEAINFWLPVIEHVFAWDMGDEFDPAGPEWDILVTRWNIVLAEATAVTGVKPFTNHLPWAVGHALDTLPGSDELLSFDKYDGDLGQLIAAQVNHRVQTLMCAVNVLQHGPFAVSEQSIRDAIAVLAAAGCDWFLAFGGALPYAQPIEVDGERIFNPIPHFGDASLVNRYGAPTVWATAFKEATSS
ncbi:MAG: hypothetical protein AB7O86_05600 [Porticoccaceae bacterium]